MFRNRKNQLVQPLCALILQTVNDWRVIPFKETLERLMLRDPLFPRGHRLAGYHYSGADRRKRAASSFFHCLVFWFHFLSSLLLWSEQRANLPCV